MPRSGFLTIERIRHGASIVGRVIDSLTGDALGDAEVLITNGPAAWQARVTALAASGRRIDRCVTSRDGFFKYLDLGAGTYRMRASIGGTRYASVTADVTVAANAVSRLDLAPTPTALVGVVKADVPAGPLLMACIRAVDSGELTYTDTNGAFTLSPLEPGTNRVFEISARRYVTTTKTFSLQTGQAVTAPPITLIQG